MTEEELVIDDDDRYSRLRLIAWWDQERLANSKVLVVGAGALGNEVLKNLALLGVGSVYVVDFDLIEESNLTRSVLFRSRDRGRPKAEAAADAVIDLNPDTKVQPLMANVITEIGLGVFRDVDVVIGCLDNREARLWVNRSCWKVNTPWIDGGIQEINGVVKTFRPPDGSCYECAMTETDYRLINLRYSCPLLRQEDLQAGKVPTAPTISSMIGALQTQEALKLLHKMPVASGEALVYNGISNQFYKTKFQHREDCLSHETYGDPLVLPLSCKETTADELMNAVAEATGDEGPWRLTLDRDLVVEIDCAMCSAKSPIMRPMQSVGMREAACPECGETGRPEFAQHVPQSSELARETLSDLGVPSYDIVKVQGGESVRYVLLNGDRDDWQF